MKEERRKQLSAEVTEIVNERASYVLRENPRLRDAYQTVYDWPDLDPLRHEIALCIILGLYQAAIALTNHLFESMLKTSLIYHDSKSEISKTKGVLDAFSKGTADARAKYGSMPLSRTINAARRAGLISKERKKQLHFLRERFRNAYSHSDKEKTFGELTVPTQGVKLEDGQFKIIDEGEPRAAELIVGQGIVQAISAEANAADYFLVIDEMVRELRKKVFPNARMP